MSSTSSASPSNNGLISRTVARVRRVPSFIKANKKRFFWLWISYQCIKGTITTSIIWIPLIYSLYYGK